jgi:hypothetical protein
MAAFTHASEDKHQSSSWNLFEYDTRHSTLLFNVSSNALAHTPRWKDLRKKPPLSSSKAAVFAMDWLRKNGYDGCKIVAIKVILPQWKDFPGLHYYEIDAELPPLDSVACVILSDGTIVVPERKPLR